MLQPGLSPWDVFLKALGHYTLGSSLTPDSLPIVFAFIAFWTGAGAWILVIHGALTNIPGDVLEAAALDGAGPVQTALHVKLPLIKKWVVYMLIVSFASGTQLFAEPQLFSQATGGILVSNSWSPNQFATWLAFYSDNFNYANGDLDRPPLHRPDVRWVSCVPYEPFQGGLSGPGPASVGVEVVPTVANIGMGGPRAFRLLLPRTDHLAFTSTHSTGTNSHLAEELGILFGRGCSDCRGPRSPGRLRSRDDRIHWSTSSTYRDDDSDADSEQRPRSATFSRRQCVPYARKPARGDLAVRFVPLRRVHRVSVLQHNARAWASRGGTRRRMHRMANISASHAAPFHADHRSHCGAQFHCELDELLPAVGHVCGVQLHKPLSLGVGYCSTTHSWVNDRGTFLKNIQLQLALPPSAEAVLLLLSAVPVILVLFIAQRWVVSGRLQGVFD